MTKKKVKELKKLIPELMNIVKPLVQEMFNPTPTTMLPPGFVMPKPIPDSWIVARDGELNYSRLKYSILGWFFNSEETEEVSIITSYGTTFALTKAMSKDFLVHWHKDFDGGKLQ
mgnify:CR=1 FL=1